MSHDEVRKVYLEKQDAVELDRQQMSEYLRRIYVATNGMAGRSISEPAIRQLHQDLGLSESRAKVLVNRLFSQRLLSRGYLEKDHDYRIYSLTDQGIRRVETDMSQATAEASASQPIDVSVAAGQHLADVAVVSGLSKASKPQIYGGLWMVERELDSGGQGQTFVVVDLKGDQNERFVLKRLHTDGGKPSEKQLLRFHDEVSAVQQLDHPNILRFVDANMTEPEPYVVTEYCSGGNLLDAMEREAFDLDWAFRVFLEICEGVRCAHFNSPEIVHRDIKPQNVLLRTPGGPAVVADFGICHIEGTERKTSIREKVGPRWFIAPELQEGRVERVLPQSDVYSLGKILYWLLSGGEIFDREKHREGKWNLCVRLKNPRMEHANRFFDKTIVENSANRYLNAGEVYQEAEMVFRLLKGGYNVVSATVPQPCNYCGLGVYQWATDIEPGLLKIPGSGIARQDWRVFQCDQCGHVQFFRVDQAKRKDWWGLQ